MPVVYSSKNVEGKRKKYVAWGGRLDESHIEHCKRHRKTKRKKPQFSSIWQRQWGHDSETCYSTLSS